MNNQKKVIVLFGAPGSGKGTQAERLSKEFNFAHVATGDLFRENLKNQTDLGKLAKSYMDKGALVPDEITASMLKERLAKNDDCNGYFLDGFPRTLPQAEALNTILSSLGMKLAGVLFINVSDQSIIHRLSERYICRQCQAPYNLSSKPPKKPGICDLCGGQLYQRDDDNPKTVQARLDTFHQQTAPLIQYYRQAGVLKEVNGEIALENVTRECIKAIKAML